MNNSSTNQEPTTTNLFEPGREPRTHAPWSDLRLMGFLPAMVLVTTLFSCAGFGSIGPFAVKGYAWVVLFLAAVFHFIGQGFRSTFPLAVWLPWLSLTVISLIFSDADNALQRTALYICPCLVGATLASQPIRDGALTAFLRGCRILLVVLFLLSLFRVGVLTTGRLPAVTGLAGESMTASILATLFAAEFALGARAAIWYWIVAFLLPVVAVVRGGIMAVLVTLPATFAPIRRDLRIGIILVAAALALVVFQSERVQHKMFQSGSGSMSELRLDNPNLATSGRTHIWEVLLKEAHKKPWFGHGANANETFIVDNFRFKGHPHNDWIRLFFDYGYVGSVLFGLTILAQTLHALAAARRTMGLRRLFLYAGASGFVPFAVLMMTDNVVLYAGFFGNLHFALLGLGYSAQTPDILPQGEDDPN